MPAPNDKQDPHRAMSVNNAPLHQRAMDFWLARGAIVLVVALQLLVINDLSLGPRWFAPILELTLLVPLAFATAWNQRRARRDEPHLVQEIARHRGLIRRAAIALTAIVTLMNFGALADLIRALLSGHAGGGQTLLLDALNIWTTNVVIFALWFWNIDHGGPTMRGMKNRQRSDFLFPQTSLPAYHDGEWLPGFIDYLFLSFTNATAFSPTDTLPLSQRAKLLMMVEASISLLTVALVAARAVNILA
jgi:uncharacterized membrane protein